MPTAPTPCPVANRFTTAFSAARPWVAPNAHRPASTVRQGQRIRRDIAPPKFSRSGNKITLQATNKDCSSFDAARKGRRVPGRSNHSVVAPNRVLVLVRRTENGAAVSPDRYEMRHAVKGI